MSLCVCVSVCVCREEWKSQQFIQSSMLNVSESSLLRSLPSLKTQSKLLFSTRGVPPCNMYAMSNQHQEELKIHSSFLNDLYALLVFTPHFLFCVMDW